MYHNTLAHEAETIHQDIMDRLDKSQTSVELCCDWLNRKGFKSKILPFTKAEKYKDRWKHVDDGDIISIIGGVECRVEVKGVGVEFTSVATFPYSTVFVDEEFKVNREHSNPLFGYMSVNKQRTGFIAIPGSTKEHWKTVEKWDSKMKEHRSFVECPKPYVKYYEFAVKQSVPDLEFGGLF